MRKIEELVTYDPRDLDTYPSVCHSPEEVRRRFGFTGGETLAFDAEGNFLGLLYDIQKEVDSE